MVWSNSVSNGQLSEPDGDGTDRFFTFEVAKTKEQEEGVSVRQGFEVRHLSVLCSMKGSRDSLVSFR